MSCYRPPFGLGDSTGTSNFMNTVRPDAELPELKRLRADKRRQSPCKSLCGIMALIPPPYVALCPNRNNGCRGVHRCSRVRYKQESRKTSWPTNHCEVPLADDVAAVRREDRCDAYPRDPGNTNGPMKRRLPPEPVLNMMRVGPLLVMPLNVS